MLIHLLLLLHQAQVVPAQPEIVSFSGGLLTLRGLLYKPDGTGPFPGLIYNHGSAPGMLNNQAFEQLGPLFASHGWVFFAPYRRGQGLSATAGLFIGDQIATARTRGMGLGLLVAVPVLWFLFLVGTRKRRGWTRIVWGAALALLTLPIVRVSGAGAADAAMVRLLATDHLSDQLAALDWLQRQSFLDLHRVAAAGNSFGGVESVLGAERVAYCAAIDASGGAESWASAPRLRDLMIRAARHARAPIFFFQAENDYDLSPSRELAAAMKEAGKVSEMKIYPAFGTSAAAGHSFAWSGSAVWADDVFRFLSTHCAK